MVKVSSKQKKKNAKKKSKSVTYSLNFPGGKDLYPINSSNTICSIGDFHLHSDGKYSPTEVVLKAVHNGVKYLSLTDHDTMVGVEEAILCSRKHNVLLIPGVEISAEDEQENIHILAYFSPGSDSFESMFSILEEIRETRYKRGKEMIMKLETLGMKLEWTDVLKIAGIAAPGRPHIAQALVDKGFLKNTKEAFTKYLYNDGPAYAKGLNFPPEEAIRKIRDCNGISVLAHPWCCKDPINLIPKLAAAGLHGLEVYHSANHIELYSKLAQESNLIMLGGSDYHGLSSMDQQPGDLPFPKKQVLSFLDFAIPIWNSSLEKRLENFDYKNDLNLCIWKEQENDLVFYATHKLNLKVEEVEEEETSFYYKHIRVYKE